MNISAEERRSWTQKVTQSSPAGHKAAPAGILNPVQESQKDLRGARIGRIGDKGERADGLTEN